ncbi:hypothetical protein BRADI_3g39650v3, partial [Brachypodium distachyon]
LLLIDAAAASAPAIAKSCTSSCGNISIQYPFGVEPGCYHGGGFNLTCNQSYHPPRLFLGDGTVQVLDISIPNGTVRINGSSVHLWTGTTKVANGAWRAGGPGHTAAAGPYFLAEMTNDLLAIGCDVQVVLLRDNDTLASSCGTFCPKEDGTVGGNGTIVATGSCSGIGCCQSTILEAQDRFADVFIMESDYSFKRMEFDPDGQTVPAVLGWRISSSACHSNGSSPSCRSNHSYCQHYDTMFGPQQSHSGHNCYCSKGYQGNPYIPDGCYDINECDYPDIYPCYGDCKNKQGGYDCQCPLDFKGNASEQNGCEDIDECKHPEAYPCYGICINMPGSFHCHCPDGTYGDPLIKQGCVTTKKLFTGLNIGLMISGGAIILFLALVSPLIKRKIKSSRANKQKERLFKQNHGLLLRQLISHKRDFGERMIITLLDLQKATNNVVAIKKSKIVVQREISDFLNEVAILSQINHRNVVKLIGCCLETEVPLLVYEFISNGTLDHHLHAEGPTSLSWDDRIRIALEVARAISYLHSAASMPVYHRDIKSANILLDDNFTAKVSDFGASRHIPTDQTGVTTAVQGTIGYLDPMYYYTGRLTDKSDVFSFGVLLIELLTKKKPSVFRCGGGVSLVSHFISLRTEGNLDEIIDPQVMEEQDGEVQEVATLATMCTKLMGEDSPTMREVEMTLEYLRATKRHAPHDSASKRHDQDQIETCYMSMEGVTKEASRQYTMEEEILTSARYPR